MNEILWREWTLIFFLKKTNVDFWKSDFSSLSLARRRRRSTLFVGSKSQIPLILALKIHFFRFFEFFFKTNGVNGNGVNGNGSQTNGVNSHHSR